MMTGPYLTKELSFNKRYFEVLKLRIPEALFYLTSSMKSVLVICSEQDGKHHKLCFLSVGQIVHSDTESYSYLREESIAKHRGYTVILSHIWFPCSWFMAYLQQSQEDTVQDQ